MSEGSMWRAIDVAYAKGYRVTTDGILYGAMGKRLPVKLRGKQRYPTFSVGGVPGLSNKYGVYGIPVHKFAAYCFYGNDVKNFECIRHLNSNVEDVSRTNLILGTHKENESDKDPVQRSNTAKIARAAQGKRPLNSKFTDEQVRDIRTQALSHTYAEIAGTLHVTKECIGQIVRRKNYSDVT